MADLKALQLAAARNATAQRRLEGLDEKYDRASALRDAPMPTAQGRYGYTSPLSAFATVLRRKRGYKQMARVEPLREEVKSRLGTGEGVLAGNALALTMAKEGRDVAAESRAEAGEAREVTEAAEATALHEKAMGQKSGDSATWRDKNNQKIAVIEDENGNLKQNLGGGKLGDIPEGYYPMRDGYIPGKAMTGNAKLRIAREITQAYNTSQVAADFKPIYAQPSSLPGSIPNEVIMKGSAQDVLKYLNEDMDADAKASLQWWARWRMLYTLPERNKVFGATLTDKEQAAWLWAENMQPGMSPDQIQERVDVLTGIVRQKIRDEANISRGDEANSAVWQNAMTLYPGMFEMNPETGKWEDVWGRDAKAAAEGPKVDAEGRPIVIPPHAPMGGAAPDPAAAAAVPVTPQSALPKAAAAAQPETMANPPVAPQWTPRAQAEIQNMTPEEQTGFNGLTPKEQKTVLALATGEEPTLPDTPAPAPGTQARGPHSPAVPAQRFNPGTGPARALPKSAPPVQAPLVKPEVAPLRQQAPIQAQALPQATAQAVPQAQLDGLRARITPDISDENLEINRVKNEKNLAKLRSYSGDEQAKADAMIAVLEQNLKDIDAELARRSSPEARDKAITEKMIAQYPKGRPTTRAEFDKLPSRLKMFYMDHQEGRPKDGSLNWID